MSRIELRAKLAEVDEQRDGLRQALRESQGRQQSIKTLEFQRDHNLHLLQLQAITYVTASPQDRRRIYQALQLQASIDEDGQVRLSGIFSPDVHLLSLVQDPPIDPSEPVPQVPEGTSVFVTLDNSTRPA